MEEGSDHILVCFAQTAVADGQFYINLLCLKSDLKLILSLLAEAAVGGGSGTWAQGQALGLGHGQAMARTWPGHGHGMK